MDTTDAAAVCYIDYTPNSDCTRFPCFVCGGSTDRQDWLAQVADLEGDRHIVCDRCAELGPDGISEMLRHHADHLDKWADGLRRQATAAFVLRTPPPSGTAAAARRRRTSWSGQAARDRPPTTCARSASATRWR